MAHVLVYLDDVVHEAVGSSGQVFYFLSANGFQVLVFPKIVVQSEFFKMVTFLDYAPNILDGRVWSVVLFSVVLITAPLLIQWAVRHVRARAQFPGPPVKSFWMGNLDETMSDDVHEKVRVGISFLHCIRTLLSTSDPLSTTRLTNTKIL